MRYEPAHFPTLVELNRALLGACRATLAQSPAVYEISITSSRGKILISRGHNWAGWEAVFDLDGEQTPLFDGPSDTAIASVVVTWIDHVTRYCAWTHVFKVWGNHS